MTEIEEILEEVAPYGVFKMGVGLGTESAFSPTMTRVNEKLAKELSLLIKRKQEEAVKEFVDFEYDWVFKNNKAVLNKYSILEKFLESTKV